MAGADADRQPKRAKLEAATQPDATSQDLSKFFKSWAWKREHRPDRDRFVKPYVHAIQAGPSLTIKQAKFSAAGFASTVWDSSIVVSKLLEFKPELVAGSRCLDLSAGCGLVGIVAANLGAAHVVATDLAPNLPLLEQNCAANTGVDGSSCKVQVLEHTWGEDVQSLAPPFDLVLACDVMYVREAVPDLIKTLQRVCRQHTPGGHKQSTGKASSDKAGETQVLMAHGRNRFAEDDFMAAARSVFKVETLSDDELHPEFHCSDVTVYRLTLHPAAGTCT